MSNAKDICTLLLTSIERSLSTIDKSQLGLRASFRRALRGALDLNNNPDYIIHGHPPKTIANSARSALLSCSSEYPAYSEQIWSPMIAGLFMVIDEVVSTQIDTLSNRVQNISIASTSSQLSASVTSAAKSAKNSRSKVIPEPVLADQPSNSTLHAIKADMLSGVRPVFRNLRHVKCVNKKCKFCADLWLALKPTKCSEVRCHNKDKRCHSSSWYVHVYPDMWSQVKQAHDNGLAFTKLIDYLPRRTPRDVKPSTSSATSANMRSTSPSYASMLAQKRSCTEPLEYDPKSPRTMDTFYEVPLDEQVIEGSWNREIAGLEPMLQDNALPVDVSLPVEDTNTQM